MERKILRKNVTMERKIMENLKRWNTWWYEKKVKESLKGIERDNKKELLKYLDLKPIKILVGARRSGKSTLMYQIIDRLLKRGVNPLNILYINLEDPEIKKADFDTIINVYIELTNVKKEECFIFIDEIQGKREWELWLKREYDLQGFKQFFISGSSGSLLTSDYSSLLTGRTLTFKIFPLSFREFLRFKHFEIVEDSLNLIPPDKISNIKHLLRNYIEFGAFPEIILIDDGEKKEKLLNEYYESIITKDIIARYRIDGEKIRRLAYYLVTNTSAFHSYKKLRAVTNLSYDAIKNYLKLFEETFLFFQLPIFSPSVKNHFSYPRKNYCIDTGIRNAAGFRTTMDIGRLYENIVFIELKRRNMEFFYWKDKRQREVDFLIKKGLSVLNLIQVCYSIDDDNTRKRELKSILSGLEHFELKEGLVVTSDVEKEELNKKNGKKFKIIYKPLWKWLLE